MIFGFQMSIFKTGEGLFSFLKFFQIFYCNTSKEKKQTNRYKYVRNEQISMKQFTQSDACKLEVSIPDTLCTDYIL